MKYKVIRTNRIQECCCVEAASSDGTIEKAIDSNCWNEVPNNTILRHEYTTMIEN